MNKKRFLIAAVALVLIVTCIVPGLAYRIDWEQNSKVYVAALDITRLAKFFEYDEIPRVLEDYKACGVTTAVINEFWGDYDEELIRMSHEAGLNICLAPSVSHADDCGLERLVQQYDVKYIKLQLSITKHKSQSAIKIQPVCDVVDKYDLTLVLTETIWQLKNEEPLGFEKYLEAADGKLLRTFNTYTKTNVDRMDYPAVYYQMYNSAYERNARFITIKHLEDEGFTAFENAARTQENIRLFCEKMESHGFINEGSVDYNTYTPNLTLISAAAAAVGVLMLTLMVDLLSKKELRWLIPAGLVIAAGAFGVTFVLPQSLVLLYPTVFAMLAPSFCITVSAVYVEKQKGKMKFVPLALSASVISVALLLISGGMIAALLGSPEYYLNNWTFRGVKLSLVLPMVFVAGLILASVYKKRTLTEYRALIVNAYHKIRWYHMVFFGAVAVVAAVYVIRSGNVNHISFAEVYFRNLLTEVFVARPRTKEFLVGWPSLVLYVYYAKTGRSKLLQYVFAFGASILFASTVNTFCHVFTLAETMFLRVFTGALFGAVVTLIALGANALVWKAIAWYKKKYPAAQ